MHKIFDELSDVHALSEYKINIGIFNNVSTIQLTDDDAILKADFLMLNENGSPLWGIPATHPLERTWLMLQQAIINAYNDCINILMNHGSFLECESRLRMLAMHVRVIMRTIVPSEIRNDVDCFISYRGRKI